MHFSALSTTCGRRPERLECKYHALPCSFSFSLYIRQISWFFFLPENANRVLIGSEVGGAATYSIWSDEVSWLMITMCRRQNWIQGARLCIYLFCTVHMSVFSLSLLGVLFSRFGSFEFNCIYLIEI